MATTTRSGGIPRAKRRPRPAFTVPFAQFRRNYAVRRIGKALFTIWLVTTLTFFVIRLLPGSPIDVYISQQMGEYGISYGEAAAAASALYSIDPRESKVTQYLSFLGQLVQGNLGKSLTSSGTLVGSIILQYLPWTLFSVGLGLLIAFTAGIGLGMLMAYRRESFLDHLLSALGSFF